MPGSKLYPLKFHPIVQSKVWGGNKLHEILGKPATENAGESWELSGVPGHVSVVSDGPLSGSDLNELIKKYGPELLGHSVWKTYGEEFPLLFKFIDAKQDLSIQLHPNDEIARSRHGSLGKTEMWYIMQADEGSRLIIDFDKPISKKDYLQHLELGTLSEVMGEVTVRAGDSYFISPGTVHAIGGGILLAEIQQSSDITYRLYDWDRPGTDGKMRELHTEEALDVIQFKSGAKALEFGKEKDCWHNLKRTKYFDVRLMELENDQHRDLTNVDSFVVYMCSEGQIEIDCEGQKFRLNMGETILIPASINQLVLKSDGGRILEIHVP
ncbi:type I phosphomannose isomerase catalytic subunit [Aureitalea marina]|uniref:Phosphohexomutase n=1 Tax=Aureitalea marina TaxID=930804 RepID=A0A2S7KQ98_9FLAO|nr:type I phosphomannose isomerase catalytic subunit [Aureitalea marina]PQB04802.1 hypothetical protein BST85_07745 [Aureitalea marina]